MTVTAAPPDMQTTIDRRSFTLGKDLQGATGSIGDALRNVPSVEVDLQGKLSMRGDPNVTILIDGKPAPQFQGAGRADALQQLGADQFERVEVITNPPAELNPEGSGVINLISKKNRGSGVTGTAYVTAASAGSKRGGLTVGYNSPALSVTASLSDSDQQNKSLTTDLRTAIDPVTDAVSTTESDFHGRNGKLLPTLSFNASANLFWKEISAESLSLPGARSATGAGGRANLDWQVRKQDLIQFNLIATGQRLQIQGSELPVWTVNLGWRHKVDDRITLTLTAQDVLASNRYARRLETAQLAERYDYTPMTRVLSLRLDYRFGGAGKTAREPEFEYQKAAPPGGA